jgi:hypothetical protein
MRNFKIVVVTLLLLILAVVVLIGIKSLLIDNTIPEESLQHDEANPSLADIYSQQMKQVEGTLKLLGVSLYGEGTHRLESDDVLVMVLESDKVNLLDFEGKEVRVRGIVRDTLSGGQKIMKVQYIEPLVESGVKLFNEIGYEFSFSYPADWEVKKEQDKVTFSAQKADTVEPLIVVYQFENVKEPLDVWLKDRDQNLYYQEVQLKVGQSTGVRRTVENGDEKIIKTYLKEGQNAYEIRLVAEDEVVRNQYFAIVDYFKTSFSLDEDFVETEVDDSPSTVEETQVNSEKSLTSLSSLSTENISKVLQKGFGSFSGRTITFDYPKSWYFSYLGDGKYGITDDITYAEAQQQITEDVSRILVIAGDLKITCVTTAVKTVENTEYTVCAREPGLKDMVDHIAESIVKTEPKV